MLVLPLEAAACPVGAVPRSLLTCFSVGDPVKYHRSLNGKCQTIEALET
jgi:hypothetical protein